MRGPEFEVTERSSDEELMRLLADGRVSMQARQKAGDVLVMRWYEQLKTYARRLFRLSAGGCGADLAEDVVQEAFALVLEKAPLFDRSRPLAPWLRSVVHNLAVNLRRRESRYQGLGQEGDQLEDRELPPFDDVASRELLARLTKEERDLFWAVFLRGEKVKDLAGRRGEPASKVYRALQELKHRVRSGLAPCETGPWRGPTYLEKDR
jgi:RNA polymerase sigma-70 factor (ECF subfamily)